MCDIYAHPCGVCGQAIEMHLADFNTGADEIVVYHSACFNRLKVKPEFKSYAVWQYQTGKSRQKVVVCALTDNAHDNRDGNHPNEWPLKLIKTKEF